MIKISTGILKKDKNLKYNIAEEVHKGSVKRFLYSITKKKTTVNTLGFKPRLVTTAVHFRAQR